MFAAVIINPHAGAIRRDPTLVDAIRGVCGAVAEVRVTRNEAVLELVARELAERGCQNVGIIGGDGSASTTLSALERAYATRPLPTIALLTGGTMNTIAHCIGTPRKPLIKLVRTALCAFQSKERGRFTKRPALRVIDRLGFLFGTGVMYGYLDAYYRAGKGRPTPVTAARVLVHGAASAVVSGPYLRDMLRETVLDVQSDLGKWPQRPYVTVAAGTVCELGLGFKAFPRAQSVTDQFELLGVHARPAEIVVDMPRIFAGRGFRPALAKQGLTGWVELTSPEGFIDYFVDGDLHTTSGPLRVTLGPLFSFAIG